MPDRSRRVRVVFGLGIAVALMFAGGAFAVAFSQVQATQSRDAGAARANCITDARTATARLVLDRALLAADRAELAALTRARLLPGSPREDAVAVAQIRFLRRITAARAADLAATPRQDPGGC